MPLRRSVAVRAARSAGALTVVTALFCSTTAAYTVGAGDTLSGIAKRHGTTTGVLASANGIGNPHHIVAGQRLVIPTSTATASAVGTHTVRPGESLSGIAARYGLALSDLVEENAIRNRDRVYAGQRLRIPGATSQVTPTRAVRAGTTHVVRPGESLSGIARRYNLPLATLMSSNGIADPDRVLVGQRLRVSGTSVDRGGRPAQLSQTEVAALIEKVSAQYGWNPAFVKALAWQESGWQNRVTSSVGAVGIMQVMPGTGRFVSRWLVGRDLDLSDPEDNVVAGVAFLSYLNRLTGGDPEKILAGYYQGLASVRRNGMYPSTERYIDNVLALKRRFS